MSDSNEEFKEKIKSIRFGAPRKPREAVKGDGTKVVEQINEHTGKLGGVHRYHDDGRQDATVLASPVGVKANLTGRQNQES
jgi:hypothetical protein